MPAYKKKYKRKVPYRSYKKKRTWRKKSKSTYKRKRSSLTLSNNISLGAKRKVNLCYVTHFTLNSGGASHDAKVFKVNSIYDPDALLGGHQPFGHDTYETLYKKYLVKGCKLSATFFRKATGSVPVKCSIFFDKNGMLDNNLDTKTEQVHGRNIKMLLTNTREKAVVNAYYTPGTFFDVVNAADDHQMSAPFGTDPILPAYAMVWCQAADRSTPFDVIDVELKLEFSVELTDPVPLVGS